MSTVSAGQNSRLCFSILASFRFNCQNIYYIGQTNLLNGCYARPASKPVGKQTGQNIYFLNINSGEKKVMFKIIFKIIAV